MLGCAKVKGLWIWAVCRAFGGEGAEHDIRTFIIRQVLCVDSLYLDSEEYQY